MRRTPLLGVASFTRATIAALLLMPVVASAQDVTEPALKAAFIYNFAKFTEWPADAVPAAKPFVMCVVGDTAVSDALERTVKGRTVAGHPMAVSDVAPAEPQRLCQILYVSQVTAGQAAQLVARLRDVPVLTISDVDGFTELGGIAQFFYERGRLRFSVHVGSATRAHLQISSRLLALAIRND
jgi:YfiR/HmsC-like